jgi:hypothetical protein
MTRTEEAPAAVAGRPDLRPASRVLAAVLLPVGPVAIALLRYRLPYFGADGSEAGARAVQADLAGQSFVLWCGFVGILTLVPAVLAVGRLTRRRTPRLTAAALLLAVPGYLALPWLIAADQVLWLGGELALDPALVAGLLDTTHPTSETAGMLFVLGHVVGTVLLGIALWRSHRVPRWVALATVVCQPLHFVAAVVLVSPPLDLLAWGLNGVAFAGVAVAVLRLPDDQWDLGPEPVAVVR